MNNYYSILPPKVRYDEELSTSAKIFYTEISALCYGSEDNICRAKNSYFAKLYNTSDRTIRRWLEQLSDKGYIKISGNTTRREIIVTDICWETTTDKNVRSYNQTTDKNVRSLRTKMSVANLIKNNNYNNKKKIYKRKELGQPDWLNGYFEDLENKIDDL